VEAYPLDALTGSSGEGIGEITMEKEKDHGAELAAVGNDTSIAEPRLQKTSVIGGKCPSDGRYWDCQCARCGSSVMFNECDNCGGEGWIEDDDWQAYEGDGHNCYWCNGVGGHFACVSSVEYCEGHPKKGREDITRGTIEWFTFDPPRQKAEGR
jgi:hypothetical protein